MDVPRHWRNFSVRYGVTTANTGTVYTYTVVYSPVRGFEDQAPYILALIDLDSGHRVLAQLTDCAPQDVHIGMKVERVFRKIRKQGEKGLILYGSKFRPLLDFESK